MFILIPLMFVVNILSQGIIYVELNFSIFVKLPLAMINDKITLLHVLTVFVPQ